MAGWRHIRREPCGCCSDGSEIFIILISNNSVSLVTIECLVTIFFCISAGREYHIPQLLVIVKVNTFTEVLFEYDPPESSFIVIRPKLSLFLGSISENHLRFGLV